MRYNGIRAYVLIALVGLCLFLPYLGKVHLFDWDEINFAEAAREMVVTGNYSTVQIDFQPFWEKPPLFIWLQAASMNLFGVNEYAARLPNALVGVFTMLLLFGIAKANGKDAAGWWAALLFAGSYLSHFYSKSALIDPLFNVLMFVSIYYLSRYFDERFYKHIFISGLVGGLAVLTKGPVAILIIGLTGFAFVLLKRAWHKRLPLAAAIWILCSLLFAGLWFGLITFQHGSWLVRDFINYQIRLLTTPDAGHGGFLLYHWVVLLIGMFPASVFFIAWFFSKRKPLRDHEKSFTAFAVISFFVVLILFTLVKTKIVHYSSFCYLPMCFVGGMFLSNKDFSFKKLKLSLRVALMFGVTFVSLAIAGLIYVGQHAVDFMPYVNDAFARGNLSALVEWSSALYLLPTLMIAVAVFVLFFLKDVAIRQVGYLLCFNAIFLELLMLFVVPKVEAHSQRAAIEFYESKQQENADVVVHGYKSYAHLFYTRKQPIGHQSDLDYLLNNPVSRPLYIVTRVDRSDDLKTHADLEFLYGKNGFEFYRKSPTFKADEFRNWTIPLRNSIGTLEIKLLRGLDTLHEWQSGAEFRCEEKYHYQVQQSNCSLENLGFYNEKIARCNTFLISHAFDSTCIENRVFNPKKFISVQIDWIRARNVAAKINFHKIESINGNHYARVAHTDSLADYFVQELLALTSFNGTTVGLNFKNTSLSERGRFFDGCLLSLRSIKLQNP